MGLISKKNEIGKIRKKKPTIIDIEFKQVKECEKLLKYLRIVKGM